MLSIAHSKLELWEEIVNKIIDLQNSPARRTLGGNKAHSS